MWYHLFARCVRLCFLHHLSLVVVEPLYLGFNVSGHGGNCFSLLCISGGNSKSTSQKYPVSASSGVSKILLGNVSVLVRNVAEQLVRNVSGHVSSDTVRNVAVRGSSDKTSNVVGFISANVVSLYGSG